MKKNRNKIILILVILVPIFYFIKSYNENIKSDILANRFQTVAKIYDVEHKLKKSWLQYKYKFEGKVYRSKVLYTDFGPSKLIGKYFLVDVHKKEPTKDIIYLDKEVTDSLMIFNSGL